MSIDIDEAASLWRQGLAGTVIARRLGVNMRKVYTLAENNRDRFPIRRRKVNGPGGITVMAMPIPAPAPLPFSDRVTRITSLGFPVTMPRVTMLDGPAKQMGVGE